MLAAMKIKEMAEELIVAWLYHDAQIAFELKAGDFANKPRGK